MRDEVWKIGKWVLMCFLSRSLDAVCLGRACLSMANRFPQPLWEPFLKAQVQRGTVTSGCMTGKGNTALTIKQLLSYLLSQDGRKAPFKHP